MNKKILIGLIFLLIFSILSYIVSIIVMKKITEDRKNPWIVEGVRPANKPLFISQNKDDDDHIPILRSDNEEGGIEFSYSFWFIIRDWRYKYGEWKHVFHKGNKTSWPNRAPGVWFHKEHNNMRVYMNVHNKVDEYVDIEDIPINKWVYVVVSVKNKYLDIYINGELVKRHILSGIPKQNFNDLYITNFGGFGGFLGKFKYYNRALSPYEVFEFSKNVPKMSSIKMRTDEPPYLSYRWRQKN
tara:strand:+ start:7948 stop:8673 length:726 start_codon:yes stop_codon:yes gene_type:complete